ncbi:hypothetical protein [Acinetobacter lwoffii]|uniref:hypothetical protein n=1 Tax=Acinetobacter lwoffii TaxID=28090 RepID=UPI00110CC573|nr:hypothetical protein [Acinetobacter lwoffii]TMS40551.1 hypothetical protein FGQ54_18470 [Acinetobacter lwoffii]
MCECLVSFSTWVENNSGQIQIVIAFGAIWLAFAGYKKVLQQIYISTKQEEQAEKNRFYELRLNLIKAVSSESHEIQILHDEFLNLVDMFYMCKQELTIKKSILRTDIEKFSAEVLSGRGLNNLDFLKTKMKFLDDTFIVLNNPDLKAEHIEKILNKIFESNLQITQIKTDLIQMKHLVDAMKYFEDR